MEGEYQKIIDFMLVSGKRLATRTGNIKDIGITKTDLTEEDLAIERGFKEIISSFEGEHVLYAEEENDVFKVADSIWVADPISGTANFIQGKPYYSIVITHLIKHKPVFAAVYHPGVDELFTAYAGKGAFLNNQPIKVSEGNNKIIVPESSLGRMQELGLADKARDLLKNYNLEVNQHSMAINYCAVACGRYDGIASFSKDSFPEFAGSLIIQEASGRFTNIEGEDTIKPADRIFIGGNKSLYNELYSLIKGVLGK